MNKHSWMIVALTALAIAAALFLPAISQPPAYHDFADSRAMLGIPNFLDVTSNAAFLLVGAAGLAVALGLGIAALRRRLAPGGLRGPGPC